MMATQEYVFGFVDPRSQARRAPVIGMQFLHERTMRTGNIFPRGAFLKPKNFVSFVLGHRRRAAARPLAAPRVAIAVTCRTPSGKAAVEISL